MVYTVYIDVLFILDFIIDYLILYATAKIAGDVLCRWKFALSASLGALFSILSLFWSALSSFFVMAAVAYIMVGISFGFRRWKHLLIFFGVSAAFGGMVFAINYITDGNLTISLKTLFISSIAGYFVLLFAFRKSATGTTKREYVKTTIEYRGKSVSFVSLVDSGNQLTDGLTNTPVLVAELFALRELFEGEEYKLLGSSPAEEVILKGEGRWRPIPFKTVGGGGILPGFCPDKVICDGKERRVLVAVSREKTGGNYSGIIGIEEE